MAKSPSQIVVGATGSIRTAPVGTAAPVDPFVAWTATWVDLGYANEDGVTIRDARTTEALGVWQSPYPARHILSTREGGASFVLRQWSRDSVTLAFGGGTITTTAGPPAHYLYEPPAAEFIDERAFGIEWLDGSKIYRLIYPRVMVTESVETNLTRTNAADLPITIGIMHTEGVQPFYFRTNDAAFAAA